MRLIVIAPNKAEGEWAAVTCRREIMTSIGYGLSGHQIFIFTPDTADRMRGFTLREGDHVFYVAGWDEDEQFVQEWSYCGPRNEENVWSIYHRKAPVKS